MSSQHTHQEIKVLDKLNYFYTFHIKGMHRKSLEAAEALKNDESGNSDREDTASKASDISSSGKHLPSSNNNSTIPLGVSSVDTMSCASVTPTSASSGGTTNVTIHDSNATSSISSTTTITASPTSHSPQMQHQNHSHQSSHHLANLDKPKEMNLVTNTQHSNYHHDNDPEAFRWVDYNRDPISFIR